MSKVIFFCPAGREPVLSIQIKYIQKLLDLDIVHEYHIWNFAWNTNDSNYVESLCNLHPKIIIKSSPFIGGDRGSQTASFQFAYMFHDYYKYDEYNDYIFIKIDDDVVFIDTNNFEKFIDFRLNSDAFLCSANVINNDQGIFYYKNGFEIIHNDFTSNYKTILENNSNKNSCQHELEERLSINFISFLGKDLKYINDEFSNGIGSNDEWRLCNVIPKKINKINEICLFMTVVHYAYGGIIDKKYLPDYERISNLFL
uniref:Glycosyltransferase n=1 Tax=viral metagenome TaxID=1070528 RepID=A0A6C0JF75_9ZZZZ